MKSDLIILAVTFSAIAIFSNYKDAECKNDQSKCQIKKVSKSKIRHFQPKVSYSMNKKDHESLAVSRD